MAGDDFRAAQALFTERWAFEEASDAPAIRERGRGEAAGRRVALVVGNDAYRAAPLRNAVNDARAMAGVLEELGFDVERVENGTEQELSAAVTRVAERLTPADVVLFYFAGHGVQVEGENYLVPVDFQGNSESAIRLGSLRVSDVQRELADARVAMLVLDACRNNPFAGTRAAGGGLASMEARGTLIAFATGAGQTASDNPAGQQGLFTQELLAALREPGLAVSDVFRRVRQQVYAASNGTQWPAVYDDLLADVMLRPSGGPDEIATSTSDPDLALRAEVALWESIAGGSEPALFEDYLRQYPGGRCSVVARTRLAELRSAPPLAPTPPRPAERPAVKDEGLGLRSAEPSRLVPLALLPYGALGQWRVSLCPGRVPVNRPCYIFTVNDMFRPSNSAFTTFATCTRASLKHAPAPMSVRLSGARALVVAPLSV